MQDLLDVAAVAQRITSECAPVDGRDDAHGEDEGGANSSAAEPIGLLNSGGITCVPLGVLVVGSPERCSTNRTDRPQTPIRCEARLAIPPSRSAEDVAASGACVTRSSPPRTTS